MSALLTTMVGGLKWHCPILSPLGLVFPTLSQHAQFEHVDDVIINDFPTDELTFESTLPNSKLNVDQK